MARQPGRDQGKAMQRHIRLLTRLAQAAPGWVNRDELMNELDYGQASARDGIARDVRLLRTRGWAIDSRGAGTQMAHRLLNQDPRLNTALNDDLIRQLSRAVTLAGHSPADLGLPKPGGVTAPAPIETTMDVALAVEDALHAVTHKCLLFFDYKQVPRCVHVDAVRRTGTGRWRIIAREDGVQKVFRIDRIQELRVGAPGSASPAQPVVKDSDPLNIPDGEPIVAVVVTELQHEDRVVRELGPPQSRRETGGAVELSIPVINRWLWRRRLYQLGTRVRLLGPQELRDEVRQELRDFLGASA